MSQGRPVQFGFFMLWFMDFPRMEGVRLFAETVQPHFKGWWARNGIVEAG